MTNNKQQTAVEQLIAEIKRRVSIIQSEPQTMARELMIENLSMDLEGFKEMEKEQKLKDFTDGYMHGNEPLNHDVIDKWYNETYGGNK
jgi:hypothetical protein